MGKLYPPTIVGTVPSFYENGTTMNIVVPFSMNKSVGVSDVQSMRMRLKTINTDMLIGEQTCDFSNVINTEKGYYEASFDISNVSWNNQLTVGTYYKIQIAYQTCAADATPSGDDIGYYSSAQSVKLTNTPSVTIDGFEEGVNFNAFSFTGVYSNTDHSEKVHEYRFNVYDDNNNMIETTGWKLHNSYNDVDPDSSSDVYNLSASLQENLLYKVSYTVRTNNGLTIASPLYYIQSSMNLDSDVKGKVELKFNSNSASVDVYFVPGVFGTDEDNRASGKFIVSKASSADNFSSWTKIVEFVLSRDYPRDKIYSDFTVESGIRYRYAIQQVNDYGIYSNRNIVAEILVGFEDAYLYDGERQLKLQFNTKITSFKEVLSEVKKTTLGSQYPFIFRNGAIKYKEFPINGLISYWMDDQECFLKKETVGYVNWRDTTEYSDQNIALERIFKMEVLDWLNDGKPKLFRSPQEGNYIVRLMNISLAPFDKTDRMIHTFSCTATEIAAVTSENLSNYGFIHDQKIEATELRWQTFNMSELVPDEDGWTTDVLGGGISYHLTITNVRPGTIFKATVFEDNQWVEKEFVIGITGAYMVKVDEGIKNLKFKIDNAAPSLTGELTFATISQIRNRYNAISGVAIKNIAAQVCAYNTSINGTEIIKSSLVYLEDGLENWDKFNRKITDEFNSIPKFYYLSFKTKEIVVLNDDPNREASTAELKELVPNQEDRSDYYLYYLKNKKCYYGYYDAKKIFYRISGTYKESTPPTSFYDITMKHQTVSINGSEIKEYETKFNIQTTGERYIKNPDTIITSVKVGPAVFAVLGYQLRTIDYTIENATTKLQNAKAEYRRTKSNYMRKFFQLYQANSNIPAGTPYLSFNGDTDTYTFKTAKKAGTSGFIQIIYDANGNASLANWPQGTALPKDFKGLFSEQEIQNAYEAYRQAYQEYRNELLIALEAFTIIEQTGITDEAGEEENNE